MRILLAVIYFAGSVALNYAADSWPARFGGLSADNYIMIQPAEAEMIRFSQKIE